jgi:O-antigen/teichoic acid export membrane protein
MRRDRTAILHFLAQLARSLAGFGTTLFTAQYFGADGLGFYSQILALLFWIKVPSNSIQTAVSKRMSETGQSTGHFSAGLISTLGYGCLVGGIILAAQGIVNDYLGANAAHLLVLLVTVNVTFDMVKGGFVGTKRVAISGWIGTAEQVLRLLGQVAFVLSGTLVVGLVYGHIFSLLIFSFVGLWLLREPLTVPGADEFNDLRQFAQYSWLGNLRGVSLNWMDILVLGLFVGDDLVGIYTAAWTLASFLSLASKSIRQTLFPELSELGADKRYNRSKSLVSDGLMFTGIFLIPGVFGGIMVGERVLAIYQTEFSVGSTILVILICARALQGFGSQFVSMLNGLDHPEIAFRINAIFFVSNISLNLIAVSLIGWYGAAFATLFSTIIYFITSWYKVEKTVGHIEFPVVSIGYQFLAAGVMASVLYVIVPTVPKGVPETLLIVTGGAALYSVVLLVLSRSIRRKIYSLAGT